MDIYNPNIRTLNGTNFETKVQYVSPLSLSILSLSLSLLSFFIISFSMSLFYLTPFISLSPNVYACLEEYSVFHLLGLHENLSIRKLGIVYFHSDFCYMAMYITIYSFYFVNVFQFIYKITTVKKKRIDIYIYQINLKSIPYVC